MDFTQWSDVPFAGGASAFLGAGTGTFFSGTGFLGTSGTLKKWLEKQFIQPRTLNPSIVSKRLWQGHKSMTTLFQEAFYF